MFNNIGGKIKALAKGICWGGIIASVLIGFSSVASINDEVAGFISLFLIVGFGSFGSWVGSLAFYGFGELVENSAIIAGKSVHEKNVISKEGIETPRAGAKQDSGEKILGELLQKGVITQNEYDLLIKKERKN